MTPGDGLWAEMGRSRGNNPLRRLPGHGRGRSRHQQLQVRRGEDAVGAVGNAAGRRRGDDSSTKVLAAPLDSQGLEMLRVSAVGAEDPAGAAHRSGSIRLKVQPDGNIRARSDIRVRDARAGDTAASPPGQIRVRDRSGTGSGSRQIRPKQAPGLASVNGRSGCVTVRCNLLLSDTK